MLDGRRQDLKLSDERSAGDGRLLLSDELLITLKAIEKEISQFIRKGAEDVTDPVAAEAGGDEAGR